MKYKVLYYLYFGVVLTDIVLLVFEYSRYFTKPLLMPILMGLLILEQREKIVLPVLALIFSFFGDCFLMYEGQVYFLLGLGSFFLAHIFYILFFLKIHQKNPKIIDKTTLFILLTYVVVFLLFILPYIKNIQIPVILYGILLGTMVVSARQATLSTAILWFFYGALIFAISDSLLACNMFYKKTLTLSILVMLTYCIAQFLLIFSSIKSLKNRDF